MLRGLESILEFRCRVNQRNHFAPISPVNPEIGKIGCDDGMLWMQLAHSYQAQIGQVGAAVSVPACQLGNADGVLGEDERELYQSGPYKIQNHDRIPEMKRRLG